MVYGYKEKDSNYFLKWAEKTVSRTPDHECLVRFAVAARPRRGSSNNPVVAILLVILFNNKVIVGTPDSSSDAT